MGGSDPSSGTEAWISSAAGCAVPARIGENRGEVVGDDGGDGGGEQGGDAGGEGRAS